MSIDNEQELVEPVHGQEVGRPVLVLRWLQRFSPVERTVFGIALVVLLPLLIFVIYLQASQPSLDEAHRQYEETNFHDGVTQILDQQGIGVLESDWPTMRRTGRFVCEQLSQHRSSVATLYANALLSGGTLDQAAVTNAVITEAIQSYCPEFIPEREAFSRQQQQESATPTSP